MMEKEVGVSSPPYFSERWYYVVIQVLHKLLAIGGIIVLGAVIYGVSSYKMHRKAWELLYGSGDYALMPVELDTFDTWYQLCPSRYYFKCTGSWTSASGICIQVYAGLEATCPSEDVELQFSYRDYRRLIRQYKHGKYRELCAAYKRREALHSPASAKRIAAVREAISRDIDRYFKGKEGVITNDQ